MKFRESQTVELKTSLSQLSRAMETLCAFANTHLGTIYFGIADNGVPVGIQISDATIRKVTRAFFDAIEPRLYPNIFEETVSGKSILVVELKNAPDKPYLLNGKALKRVGTSNTSLSRTEIELMLYERENPDFHYDRSELDTDPGSMDKKQIEWFYQKAHEERNLPLEESPEGIEKLNIITNGKPNVAGILAFGTHITRHLPTAFTKCAVFEGVDKTGRMLDHLDIKTNVFIQIDRAENFVLRNIRKQAEVNPETGRRESRYEVPYRAIREAIANAMAHRDYRLASTIDVAVFDDRIEIWSPGELPQGMTLEQLHLPHRSVLRNSTLAELLYLTRYIERWGTGIQNMKNWMQGHGLPEPQFLITGHSMVTVLNRPAAADAPEIVSKPQVAPQVTPQVTAQVQKLLTIMEGEMDRNSLQNALGLSARKNFRLLYLQPALESGLIEMTIPNKPRSSKQKYRLTENGREFRKKLGKQE
jgi:ATP-dependent DNA helicase RecG